MEVYICMVELSAVRSCGPPSGQQCRYGREGGQAGQLYGYLCTVGAFSTG